jgi:hypothetical protein
LAEVPGYIWTKVLIFVLEFQEKFGGKKLRYRHWYRILPTSWELGFDALVGSIIIVSKAMTSVVWSLSVWMREGVPVYSTVHIMVQ